MLLNFSVAGLAISSVDVWALQAAGDACALWATQQPTRKLIEATDIVDVAIHTKIGHGLATTLLPPEFRCKWSSILRMHFFGKKTNICNNYMWSKKFNHNVLIPLLIINLLRIEISLGLLRHGIVFAIHIV